MGIHARIVILVWSSIPYEWMHGDGVAVASVL